MYQPGLFTAPSTWRPTPVSQLPSWAGVKRVGLDVETRDPDLKTMGPGVRRGGKIIGISFALEDGPAHYLPIGHTADNLDPTHAFGYLRDQFQHHEFDVVGANLAYDLDYLWEAGVEMPKVKRYRDIQIADPLIEENHLSYSMESISKRLGIPGKDERVLREGAATLGWDRKRGNADPKKEMWKLAGRYCGEYAIQDVRLPLTIIRRQERVIDEEDLWQIYDLEMRLTPVLVKMRRRGVAIDFQKLQQVEDWTVREQRAALNKIHELTGYRLGMEDVNVPKAKAEVLKRGGVTNIPTTPKTGQPSIDKVFLAELIAQKNPVAASLQRALKMDKVRGTFCGSVRRHAVNGRIHATFNQLRRGSDDESDDDTGARYGRLSSTDPNMQQMPARDPEIGKLWRSIFIPDDGKVWMAADYSQQEPRLTYHYAALCGLPGAEEMVRRFCEDPKADSHTEMAKMCYSEEDLKARFKQLRGYAKEIFLGITYGMGGAKLCRKLGFPTAWRHSKRFNKMIEVAGPEGQVILDNVDRRMPFLRQLARLCEDRAKKVGYIVTLLGRRCRFPLNPDGTRDWAHKALNRLIQGSAADMTKKAVVDADDAGHEIQIQVHDELDMSVRDEKHAQEVAEIMRTCVVLKLPSKVDIELGSSWGESMG